jgi:SAM-dependent methyltransferase
MTRIIKLGPLRAVRHIRHRLEERVPALRARRTCRDYSETWRQLAEDIDSVDLSSMPELPRGLASGGSERAVEYAWLLANAPFGRMLDAGSTLNHRPVLDRLEGRYDDLHIVTLAPEDRAFIERGISYLYADLRELPFRDDTYDTVACLSVLEHIGLDNTIHGAAGPTDSDPVAEAITALRELVRVTRPGGRVLITVPFGEPRGHGWVRQFDPEGLRHLISSARAVRHAVEVFHDPACRGWERTDTESARDSRFREWSASAVACVILEL